MTETTAPATTPRPKFCQCSVLCAVPTKGTFAQGHDAKMVAQLVSDVMDGSAGLDETYGRMADLGFSESLRNKFWNATKAALAKREAQQERDAARWLSLADAVMEHAQTNYNKGGWDVVVECWTREEIAVGLKAGNITSKRAAIDSFKGAVSVWADQQADAEQERRLALGDEQPAY